MTAAEDRERQQRQIARVHEEADIPLDATREDPADPDIPPDRTRQFTHVSFSRMRTTWGADERIKMAEITRLVNEVIMSRFLDAYDLIDRIFTVVREPELRDGELRLDGTGRPVWKLNEAGWPIENWKLLGDQQRDDFLWEITTHLFSWEQAAEQMWGDAMFAKGIWEESFALGFTSPIGRLTVDDRTQRGHLASMEHRYFAIFQSLISRRAQGLVRSMRSIERRLARD